RHLRITFLTMVAGWLAIAGFPGLAGFFSKDEILWRTFSTTVLPGNWGNVLWGIAAVTALLTAIYMTRMMVMTFFGKERFGNEAHHDHHHDKHHAMPHESPPRMTVPLVILAILSIIGGYIGVPAILGGSNQFEHFLEPAIAQTASSHAATHQEISGN